jgi:hypothetical protein
MEMAMMGLAGTVVGASAMGVSGVVKSLAESYFPSVAEGRGHRHQINAALQSQRYDSVRMWRSGLCGARDQYREWEAGPKDCGPPNVVGDEWFEGLRPNLPNDGAGAALREAHEVHCDNPTVKLLSLEIGRVEQEWMDEVSGRRRRRRRH